MNLKRFWVLGFFLLAVALLVAEHYIPTEVIDGSTADSLVASHEGSAVRRAAYLFIGAFGVISLVKRDRYRMFRLSNPVAIIFCLLFSWSAASVFWADEPLVSARRFLVLILIYLGAAGLSTYLSPSNVVRFIALAATFHASVGVISEVFLGVFNPLDPAYRFAGTLRWNEQGLLCLFLTMSALAASDYDDKYRIFFQTLSCYGGVLLVLTKSRSSMIGLAVALTIYLVLTRSKVIRTRILVIGGITLLMLLISGGLTSAYRVLSREGEGVENLTGRQPLWEECLVFVKERPILGYGYEDFWTTEHVDYLSGEFHWGISAAHSGYLESLLTIGLVGAVLHTSTLMISTHRATKIYRIKREPILGLIASTSVIFLVVGTLEAVLIIKASPVSFFFSMLICSLCLGRYSASTTRRGDSRLQVRIDG